MHSNITTAVSTLRILNWLLDRVVHCAYIIVCKVVGNMPELQPTYGSNISARITDGGFSKNRLGFVLMETGHKQMDWKAPYYDDDKPSIIPQLSPNPCSCKQCFFCKIGKTNGN
jgi:hypothetical protein